MKMLARFEFSNTSPKSWDGHPERLENEVLQKNKPTGGTFSSLVGHLATGQ